MIARGVEDLFATLRVSLRDRSELRIHLLPDSSVGVNAFGLGVAGVASIYKSASFRVEQVSQLLIGESFDIMQQKDQWLRIHTHADNYLGWIHSTQTQVLNENEFKKWQEKPTVTINAIDTQIFEKPDKDSRVVRTAPFDSRLPLLDWKDGWTSILLPDKRKGWIQSKNLQRVEKRTTSGDDLVECAERFLGAPYQWGGRSPRGFDCSGFVQVIFNAHGIKIPRDASQQYQIGEDAGSDVAKLRKGDILFFSEDGKNATHVGIYIGKKSFIHAQGFVRHNSFEQRSSVFSRRLQEQFIGAKRILVVQH